MIEAEGSVLALLRETSRKFLSSQDCLAAVRRLSLDERGYEMEYWSAAAELGWMSLLGESTGENGESGGALAALVVIAEELGRAIGPGPIAPVNIVCATLARHQGFPDGARILGELGYGSKTATWCHAERSRAFLDNGSDVLVTHHSGELVINGRKDFVEAGNTTDYFLVTANLHGDLVQVLIPSTLPGIHISPLKSLDLSRRFATVEFFDCVFPVDSMISDPATAWEDVERQREMCLILQCADCVGLMDEVLTRTIEYAQQRVAFGRTIASYQAIKDQLAIGKMDLEVARGAVWGSVAALEWTENRPSHVINMMKAFVGDAVTRLVQSCIQIHGAIGVTWEHDLHLFLRRATTNRLLYGTPGEHRRKLGAMETVADTSRERS